MGKDGMRSRDPYGPNGELPIESAMQARRVTAGVEHFDNKQPFVLSREPYRVPKPKRKGQPDVLISTLDKAWSEMRTEELGRPVFYFKVYNETQGSEYTTELFEGINGEPCGVCNCPASCVCKHLFDCCMQVLTSIYPQFGEREKSSEFMVGLRLCPPGTGVEF